MWATGKVPRSPLCSWLVMTGDRGTNSHVWLFEGAEGGKWVEELERKYGDRATEPPASAPDSEDDEDEDGDEDGDYEHDDVRLPLVKRARTA